MKTKPFTLVTCPDCLTVLGIEKNDAEFTCHTCKRIRINVNECYKLGLKKIEETGEEIWVGVKED